MADEPAVVLERQGHLATLTLNRPDAMNAINADLLRDLRATCRELEADDQVWAVVVRGSGSGRSAPGRTSRSGEAWTCPRRRGCGPASCAGSAH